MARPPQPLPSQFFEPPVQPDPLRGLWTGGVAAVSLLFVALGELFKQIAARWRGIVLMHLFFLTLWLAIQVFFFVTGAHWCLPSEGSKFAQWFWRFFPQISRCMPVVSVLGSLPTPGTPALSSVGLAKAPWTGLPASSPAPQPSSPVAPAAPSPDAPAAPSPDPGSRWSSKSIANCWRDRSLGSSCYARAQARRKSTPARSRYPAHPCRNPYECGWDAI